MNKPIISIHWLLTIGLLGLLLTGQQSMAHYDPLQCLKYAAIGYAAMVILLSFMIIKNHKQGLIHICIGLIGLMALFKLFQVSLVNVWPAYLALILAGLILMLLKNSLFKGWGLWIYLLWTYLLLPVYGIIVYFRDKLVLTSVLDNDLSIVNGINPVYTGIGYLATATGAKNYLGYGPLLILTITLTLVYLPTQLKRSAPRKDVKHEEITL